jgi:hypothetical protein
MIHDTGKIHEQGPIFLSHGWAKCCMKKQGELQMSQSEQPNLQMVPNEELEVSNAFLMLFKLLKKFEKYTPKYHCFLLHRIINFE